MSGSIQRSPQHRKVHFSESRFPAQLPVRVVADPRVVVRLPADTAQIKCVCLIHVEQLIIHIHIKLHLNVYQQIKFCLT